MKYSKIKLLVFSISVIIFFLLMLMMYFNRHSMSANIENKYFDKFNVSFSGIVRNKKEVSNGAGIVTLDISESTTKSYDVRDINEIYLCVIKDEKAEVIMNRLFLIKIDDSLVIDSNTKKINLFRNNLLKESWDFQLPTNATFFYTFAKMKHEL